MIHFPETPAHPWQPPAISDPALLEPVAALTDDFTGGVLHELSTAPGRDRLRETLQGL